MDGVYQRTGVSFWYVFIIGCIHTRETRKNLGMDVICPDLCFRRINQEAIGLDPDVET